MPEPKAPYEPGQTGRTPRVEVNLPPVDPAEAAKPSTLPEFPDPHSTTGQLAPIVMRLEGDDRAKNADDSAIGSDSAAAGRT